MDRARHSEPRKDIQALKLTLGLYTLIFTMKLTVYFVSGVMALLGEALHTLSDIFISGFLLVATIWSRREANEVHMFGYGYTNFHSQTMVPVSWWNAFGPGV